MSLLFFCLPFSNQQLKPFQRRCEREGQMPLVNAAFSLCEIIEFFLRKVSGMVSASRLRSFGL